MKRTLALVVSGMLIGPLIGGYWYFSTTYIWDRDIGNQKRIADAYVRFYLETKMFPSDLPELVRAGYLPQKGWFYMEPPGFLPHAVDVRDGCYIVSPPPGGNIENSHMIGRRYRENGKERVKYEPLIASIIRDRIIMAQHPRDVQKYNDYIAPLVNGSNTHGGS